MFVNHYIMNNGQTLSSSLAHRLSGEEWLEYPVPDLIGDAGPRILDSKFDHGDFLLHQGGGDPDGTLLFGIQTFPLDGVTSIDD